MKKTWSFLNHRTAWMMAGAVLAVVAIPIAIDAVLKALGWIHGASLPTWLLDVGQNVPPIGAAGGLGAGAAGAGAPYGPDLPRLGFLWLTPQHWHPYLYAQPSTNSQIVAHPPAGMRVIYNQVLDGANGQPSWYYVTAAGSTPGWVPASDVSTTAPSPRPPSRGTIPIDPNEHFAVSTGSLTSGARG